MEIWNEDATWRHNNIFDLLDAFLWYGVNDQLAPGAVGAIRREFCNG